MPKLKSEPELGLTIALEKWEWEYSLGVPWMKDADDSLDESDALRLYGTTSLSGAPNKPLQVSLVAFPSSAYEREARGRKQKFEDVGKLHRVAGGFEGGIGIASNYLPLVITMLAAGLYREIFLTAAQVERRAYLIRSYWFKQTPTEDELIEQSLKAFERKHAAKQNPSRP